MKTLKNKTTKLNPERLTQARLASVLNMTDLAEKTDLSRQAISQFEKGTSQPAPDTLRKLASELNVEVSFLVSEITDIEQTLQGVPNHRSMATSTAKIRKQANTYLDWMAMIGSTVSNFVSISKCDLPDFNIDDFNNITETDIEDYAEKTRRHFGLNDGPISNLTTLLENHGILIGHYKFHKKVDGISAWYGDRPFVIINENATAVRARYDLAHELAHLVLHKGLIDETDLQDRDSFKLIEKQANYFASCFLMPEVTFSSEIYGLDWNSLIEIKKRWLVSIQAIIMRLHSLEILSESQKIRHFQIVNQKKARRFEPLDGELKIEKPTVFVRILELLSKENILKMHEFPEETTLKKDFLERMMCLSSGTLSKPVESLSDNVVQLRIN